MAAEGLGDAETSGAGGVRAVPHLKDPSVSPRTTVLQSMKLGVDVNRHKEIIVKAISAVLLLLLKHFKLNHIYQVRQARVWQPPTGLWGWPGPRMGSHSPSFLPSLSTWPSIWSLPTASRSS